jgi:hypothetical protein
VCPKSTISFPVQQDGAVILETELIYSSLEIGIGFLTFVAGIIVISGTTVIQVRLALDRAAGI